MAHTEILVDTNSYLRLAQNIHPLLGIPFGEEKYALYILPELKDELQNSRLKNRFPWALKGEYAENRQKTLVIGKKKRAEIQETYEYMWEYVVREVLPEKKKGPSPVDTLHIATAAECEIQVVTDDQDMIALAETYGVPHLTSLELLKLMLDNDHIELGKIQQIAAQWQYECETPYKDWKKEYRKLFGSAPPK